MNRSTEVLGALLAGILLVASANLIFTVGGVGVRTVTETTTATITTTTAARNSSGFTHSQVLLSSKTVTVNASGFNEQCNCSAPGTWIWDGSNVTFAYFGFVTVSLAGQTPSFLEASYQINGTTAATTWCLGSQPGCTRVGALSLPVVPSTQGLQVVLLNSGNDPIATEVSVVYHY